MTRLCTLHVGVFMCLDLKTAEDKVLELTLQLQEVIATKEQYELKSTADLKYAEGQLEKSQLDIKEANNKVEAMEEQLSVLAAQQKSNEDERKAQENTAYQEIETKYQELRGQYDELELQANEAREAVKLIEAHKATAEASEAENLKTLYEALELKASEQEEKLAGLALQLQAVTVEKERIEQKAAADLKSEMEKTELAAKEASDLRVAVKEADEKFEEMTEKLEELSFLAGMDENDHKELELEKKVEDLQERLRLKTKAFDEVCC